MDGLWIALGVVVLVVTFVDIFLTVLNYNEPGIIVNRLVRLQWILIRSVTRRVSRRWRPLVLRQVTGILILSTILWWILGVVLGFTLIYLGLIGLGAFQISQGVVPDFIGALYLSVGQFATVGADNISPAGGWVNLIPVLEALASVVLLSFIITFLSNIYGVIQFLRSLCADFFSAGPGVGNPVDALRPYFPNGTPRDIDRHLNELVDDFNLYCDSLRQDHAAYHFQSGEDQFSLPFALYMTSGVAGALRWGLPTGSDATLSPSLVRLTEVFDDFRELRYRRMRWPGPVVPDVVPIERFRQDLAEFSAHSAGPQTDPWVLKFLTLNAEMAGVIGTEVDPVIGAEEAYGRYVRWLEFAYPAQHFVTRVSRDLDYQPIYRGVAAAVEDLDQARSGTTDAAAPAARTPHAAHPARRTGGPLAWARRRHLFLDPGFVRLSTALRTLGAVVAAVVVATAVAAALQVDPIPAGVFAALIAVFSVPMSSGWGAGLQRSTGLLALIPVGAGIAAGAFLPRDPVTAVIVLAVIAAAAVWVGRFGPRWAMWGQLGFVAYYFSLLLAVRPEELTAALIAAGIGVVSGWVSNLLPRPRRERQVRAGIRAVAERTSVLIDAAIDALAGGASRRFGRVLRAENAALRGSVTSLSVLLGPDSSDSDPNGRGLERRLQAFDVQLAAENLLRALPVDSDFAITVDERSILAGELAALQQRADSLRRGGAGAARSSGLPPADEHAAYPGAMPTGARRVHDAVVELSGALVAMLSEPIDAGLAPATGATRAAASDSAATERAPARGRAAVRATDRRAVQMGLATGLALFLASFVSSTHQYWAALPAYQALTGSDGERLARTMQRLVGTVIGAAAAFGLALMTGHDSVVAFAVVVVSVFFMSFLRAVASSWTAFWQTVLLATMYDLLAQLDAEAIHVRVLETIIGAAVALLIAALVLPTRTRARVLEGMAALVATAATITHTALRRLADRQPVPHRGVMSVEIANLETTMQSQLDEVLSHAGAQRRDPGALQHSGIETQLTSLTALAFYSRRIAATAEKGVHTPDAALWSRLDAATRDNFASMIAVLDGRLPSRVHDLREFTAPIGRSSDGTAIMTVERINETLVTYMAAVQPGSTDAGSNSA